MTGFMKRGKLEMDPQEEHHVRMKEEVRVRLQQARGTKNCQETTRT